MTNEAGPDGTASKCVQHPSSTGLRPHGSGACTPKASAQPVALLGRERPYRLPCCYLAKVCLSVRASDRASNFFFSPQPTGWVPLLHSPEARHDPGNISFLPLLTTLLLLSGLSFLLLV